MSAKMPKLWTMFEDNAGGFSSTRVYLGFIILISMFTWSWACYQKKDVVPFPDNMVMLIVGFGGVKAVQRFGEKDYSVNMDPGIALPTPPTQVIYPPIQPHSQPYYPPVTTITIPPTQPQPVAPNGQVVTMPQ